jgi:hypothetical protein
MPLGKIYFFLLPKKRNGFTAQNETRFFTDGIAMIKEFKHNGE